VILSGRVVESLPFFALGMDRVVGDGVDVDGVERKNLSLFVCISYLLRSLYRVSVYS